MKTLIQYEGCIVSPTTRTYNFHVIDAPGETRQFTVQVLSESFRLTPLKFQDGPPITFERLQHEIDIETQELHAVAGLNISGSDIQEYLVKHHPQKRLGKWEQTRLTSVPEPKPSVTPPVRLPPSGSWPWVHD